MKAGPVAFYRPDGASPPVSDHLKGTWTGEAISPAGDSRREHVLRFVDGNHLVWEFAQISRDAPGGPEVRSQIVLKGRYEIAGSELRFTVHERHDGVRLLPRKPDDKEPRLYELTPLGEDGAFRVQPKPVAPGFNWFDVRLHRSEE